MWLKKLARFAHQVISPMKEPKPANYAQLPYQTVFNVNQAQFAKFVRVDTSSWTQLAYHKMIAKTRRGITWMRYWKNVMNAFLHVETVSTQATVKAVSTGTFIKENVRLHALQGSMLIRTWNNAFRVICQYARLAKKLQPNVHRVSVTLPCQYILLKRKLASLQPNALQCTSSTIFTVTLVALNAFHLANNALTLRTASAVQQESFTKAVAVFLARTSTSL